MRILLLCIQVNLQFFIMIDFKEEISNKPALDNYIKHNLATDSQNNAIHSSIAKGRLSFGLSNQLGEVHKRRVINLQKENKGELPVLGHKCKNLDSHRMYESLIEDDGPPKSAIKKIRLSELVSHISKGSAESMPKKEFSAYQRRAAMVTINHCKEYVPRKKKKAGYEGQKLRLNQNENQINKFLSNYERVDLNSKLKDAMQNLRQDVIRANSSKFALLSKMSD